MRSIEALLRKEIGLDAASIGSSLIERTIRLRMKHHGLKREADYHQMLRESVEEFDELTEAIVVTETWFFRDRQPFEAFTQFAMGEWMLRHTDGPMRILSVPCSSGEEPYSLAMALLDAGITPERFHIDAVDISAHALRRAQRGVYGKNSFRGKDLEFRERHFVAVKEGYALDARVRHRVSFARANVLDEDFLADSATYDFIFCRNLLIYFDRATQILTLAKLHRLLAADGVLFVGPAEMPLVNESGFTSAKLPHAFACRKIDPNSRSAAKPVRRSKTPVNPPLVNGAAPALILPTPTATTAPSAASKKSGDTMIIARQLADSGQLEAAAGLCRNHLSRHHDCAEAYYLLGLVHDATNDPQAIAFYRKALYLDPNHYESLVHAALCLERTGDATGARALKRRAERAQTQLRPHS